MSGALEASGGFEVPTPILNSPFVEPAEYWDLREGEPPQRLQGRRTAGYWYRDPRAGVQGPAGSRGLWREMSLVNSIRVRLAEWRTADRPGISRVTAELLEWWERDGRDPRLFFAQKEAVETIVFLTEARADFLTGVTVPRDDPGEERRAQGYPAFDRRCCKMATGTGKSTVTAMLAAWSILNKQADRDSQSEWARISNREGPCAGLSRSIGAAGHRPAAAQRRRLGWCAADGARHVPRHGAYDRSVVGYRRFWEIWDKQ